MRDEHIIKINYYLVELARKVTFDQLKLWKALLPGVPKI